MERAPVTIALIVAIAENGVIGRDGGLPWRLSSDLKLFRRLTMGKPLVMGRKTFASLGKPLDGRDTIVATRDPGFSVDGVIAAGSFEDALARAWDCAARRGVDEIFVIGGSELFEQSMPLVSRIYLTRVHAAPPGDVFFPSIDWDAWHATYTESHPSGPKDAYAFTFSVLERR